MAFRADEKYSYSFLQEIFADVPLGLVFATAPGLHRRFYEFELGGIAGCLVYKESCYATETPNSSTISSTDVVKNLNSVHYGLYSKVNCCKLSRDGNAGFFYSMSGNYYFNELFKAGNQTPSKNFSVQLGIGIFITQKGMR